MAPQDVGRLWLQKQQQKKQVCILFFVPLSFLDFIEFFSIVSRMFNQPLICVFMLDFAVFLMLPLFLL